MQRSALELTGEKKGRETRKRYDVVNTFTLLELAIAASSLKEPNEYMADVKLVRKLLRI